MRTTRELGGSEEESPARCLTLSLALALTWADLITGSAQPVLKCTAAPRCEDKPQPPSLLPPLSPPPAPVKDNTDNTLPPPPRAGAATSSPPLRPSSPTPILPYTPLPGPCHLTTQHDHEATRVTQPPVHTPYAKCDA